MRIGDLARRLRVSTRTLRHYESIGLLRPERVDAATGYRRYGPAELLRGLRIEQLKAAGIALVDIAGLLDGTVDRDRLLSDRRRELRELVARHERELSLLDALGAPDGAVADVGVVAVPAHTVRAVAASVAPEDLGGAVRRGVQRLRRELRAGEPGGSWTFTARFPLDLDATSVIVEVGAARGTAGPTTTRWEPATCAQTTVVGPYHLLPIGYDAVLAHIEAQGLTPVGRVTETYHLLGSTPRTTIAIEVAPAGATP